MEKIETYEVASKELLVSVNINKSSKGTNIYELIRPKLHPATKALLDEIKIELITEVNISGAEILDIKEIDHIKERFKTKAKEMLKKKLQNLPDKTSEVLIGILIQDMLGLGELEPLLSDENLEEIVINSSTEAVRVYHKKYGWLETNITLTSEPQIKNYSSIIARRAGRQITTLTPLLDAYLPTGDRVNAVLHPISGKGHTITIRKFARDPWTMTDFINNKTCSAEIFSLIWLCIQYEMSILISGGTASGKTSFLNVIMPFIPENQRLLSIEDTREIQLPSSLYWCPLTTREPNPEGKGGVTMLDLLVNSLRMRPDRIIFGEIRKKEQAEVLFEALHTGHSIYSTVHADSIGETIRRLVNPPINLPANLLSAVNLNVVMFRDRRKGIRRVLQVGELVDAEGELISIKPNLLFRWKPDIDQIIKHNEPIKLYEDLSKYTGMTLVEIKKDLANKKKLLDLMVKNNFRTVEEVGSIIRNYYLNPKYDANKIINMVKNEQREEKEVQIKKSNINITKEIKTTQKPIKKLPERLKIKKLNTKKLHRKIKKSNIKKTKKKRGR
ncbi:MAG: ATPase, T2SS/T4P/T4SS family [Candidatus Woesearchaeota archaeon]